MENKMSKKSENGPDPTTAQGAAVPQKTVQEVSTSSMHMIVVQHSSTPSG